MQHSCLYVSFIQKFVDFVTNSNYLVGVVYEITGSRFVLVKEMSVDEITEPRINLSPRTQWYMFTCKRSGIADMFLWHSEVMVRCCGAVVLENYYSVSLKLRDINHSDQNYQDSLVPKKQVNNITFKFVRDICNSKVLIIRFPNFSL